MALDSDYSSRAAASFRVVCNAYMKAFSVVDLILFFISVFIGFVILGGTILFLYALTGGIP